MWLWQERNELGLFLNKWQAKVMKRSKSSQGSELLLFILLASLIISPHDWIIPGFPSQILFWGLKNSCDYHVLSETNAKSHIHVLQGQQFALITDLPCAATFLMMRHMSFSVDLGYGNQAHDTSCNLLITLSTKCFSCCVASALCSHADLKLLFHTQCSFFSVGTISFVRAQVRKSLKAWLLFSVVSFTLFC